ncbi:heparan-alpha-glucosaminide N-acetyltransferase domain-containing protein [Arachidicoccus terrestris]|uniref:heparan-alpha-glucosaminide N-acetyltransferase domain-containing protein n=1 Tax=Arachidicoccus terrestris TaxID=2875539 RepID=UPI001CC4EA5B|nr:heparan-alpha-glucosaminide N-acetyltransferase domain-containing protein [Arachidicoccus terrestris]UAY54201.1 hypothetical protein K9M52_12125 [Arachidicoccus terrestris]
MKPRNLTIDIAKGLVVLIIPATHVILYYSTQAVRQGVLGSVLRCFSEGVGAQVLMFLLGFSFFLGRDKSVKFIFKRSISIFLLAYLLNFIGFVLPTAFGLMPDSFFSYYRLQTGVFGVIDLLMVGAIFQFAAISYLVCGILHHFRVRFGFVSFFTMIVLAISPMAWGIRLDNFLLDYVLKLLNGCPPAVFFPFFPWGVYPLLGYIFGILFKNMPTEQFYRTTMITGVVCVIIGISGVQIEPRFFNMTFYRLGPAGTLLHCGLVLLWLNMSHFLAAKLRKGRYFLFVVYWCSTHITAIYLIQWVLICWLFPFYGFMKLDSIETLKAIIVISGLTVLLVAAAEFYKRSKTGRKRENIASTPVY